jgi:hypothetical protein
MERTKYTRAHQLMRSATAPALLYYTPSMVLFVPQHILRLFVWDDR